MLQDATGLPIHALKRVNLYKDQQKSVKRVRMEIDPAEIQRNRWNGCVFLWGLRQQKCLFSNLLFHFSLGSWRKFHRKNSRLLVFQIFNRYNPCFVLTCFNHPSDAENSEHVVTLPSCCSLMVLDSWLWPSDWWLRCPEAVSVIQFGFNVGSTWVYLIPVYTWGMIWPPKDP